MTEREGIAGRIHRARLRLQAELGREVTTGEVGTALGVTGVTVARWERGEREPDLATIARLADVLRTSPAHLAFGEPAGAAPSQTAPYVITPEEGAVPAVRPPERAPAAKRRPKAG